MINKYADDSLALHTDAYELNMIETYWREGIADRNAIFEVYFRDLPFQNGYAIYAGLERVIQYIQNLHFSEPDLQYLKEEMGYQDDFIEYLRNFKIRLSIRSMVEGEIVFNNEPLMQIEGPISGLSVSGNRNLEYYQLSNVDCDQSCPDSVSCRG